MHTVPLLARYVIVPKGRMKVWVKANSAIPCALVVCAKGQDEGVGQGRWCRCLEIRRNIIKQGCTCHEGPHPALRYASPWVGGSLVGTDVGGLDAPGCCAKGASPRPKLTGIQELEVSEERGPGPEGMPKRIWAATCPRDRKC